nr:hypothetical protein [uncultured Lachnoclostridium sp.]
MNELVFQNKTMTFEAFINRLSDVLVPKILMAIKNPPKDRVSQNEAFRIYKQGNVRRWVKTGKLKAASKRPGKIEYRVKDLDELYNVVQDYFDV